MNKKAYIIGSGCISPQNTTDVNWFFDSIHPHSGDHFNAIEPEDSYKKHINPNMLRRMGRAIKMGVTAASIALEEANVKEVDAIITGSGLGCFEDSERFLLTILRNDEQFLTPTLFIQSTHNTVGSQIGLILKCHNYNYTYVHRGFSFETVVMDALMTFDEGKHTLLIGGIDEHSKIFLDLCRHAKKITDIKDKYYESTGNGLQIGEGAAFFVVSDEKKNATASIDGVGMVYKPSSSKNVLVKLNAFLAKHDKALDTIDCVLLGFSGDKDFDRYLNELLPLVSNNSATGYFKHLCGEYYTAGAFGTWVASKILEKQKIPDALRINSYSKSSINNVLIINGYTATNFSFILLSKC